MYCIYGSAKLPNGNGQDGNAATAAERQGYLGGVIDDYLQDYCDAKLSWRNHYTPDDYRTIGRWYSECKHTNRQLLNKPPNSMSTIEVIAKYGLIENWDVSQVTNMVMAFSDKEHFNADISKWDVRKVLDMTGMFQGAYQYQGNLCGHAWVDSTALGISDMFHIADKTSYCSCEIGKAGTQCEDCSVGRYNDIDGFVLSECTACGKGRYNK